MRFDELRQDVVLALRSLRSHPSYALVVVATLALLSWGSPRWMIQFIDTATWLLPFLVVVQREAKRNPA